MAESIVKSMLTRRMLLAGTAGFAAAAATSGMLPSAARAACEHIVVGTWGGDYSQLLDENVVKPLLTPKNIDVVDDIAGQNPRKTKLLAEKGARRGSMDVACLGDADMYEINQAGVFMPLDAKLVPNMANVLPKLQKSYSAPHIYSGKVIVYNADKIKSPPASYADLWEPRYKGKVGLVDLLYFQFIESAALISGGNAHNYEPGKAKLMELKKMGVKIYPSNEALAAALKSEEVWITIMWRARAVQWKKAGIPVDSAVPREGATPIVFEMAIPNNAPDKDCAPLYLNAMLDPKAQVGFADKMGYVPTVTNAVLPPDLKKLLDFTPEEQANFFIPDLGYIAKNNNAWLEWWNKEFKA
ncbi:MAG TPA: extracellular solute-binding protein [Candidatus Sulfotelmatobacter sp.]|nr:extracellular solute-binding protein [Candidatus Sulfotelmatobacter sp.]